jgi:hypothetical protein
MPFDIQGCAADFERDFRSWDAARQQRVFGKTLTESEFSFFAMGLANEMAKVSKIMDQTRLTWEDAIEIYKAEYDFKFGDGQTQKDKQHNNEFEFDADPDQ